jgi:hypothetical protein
MRSRNKGGEEEPHHSEREKKNDDNSERAFHYCTVAGGAVGRN